MLPKIDFNLTGVPQTLLLPLFGRAEFSREQNPLFYDAKALQLVDALQYDFTPVKKQIKRIGALYCMARAYQFDLAAKAYLNKYPKAVVVSLGAGLETAFYRVDNGTLTWIDLDLPEVMALRKKLLPNEARVHSIDQSIHDSSWMQTVKQYSEHVFFFAGGLFMYFKEDEVKNIFKKLAESFPGAELIFDSISVKGLSYSNKMLKKAQMKNARLQWGLDHPKSLEAWSPHIKLLGSFPCYEGIKSNNVFTLLTRIKMMLNDCFNKNAIVHVKFTKN